MNQLRQSMQYTAAGMHAGPVREAVRREWIALDDTLAQIEEIDDE